MNVLTALSGGVDSSAAALLLLRQGHQVAGVTARMFDGGGDDGAAETAAQLGIPHHVVDLTEAFAAHVITPFIDAYRGGETPNPCIFCNRTMKFGLLLEQAAALGFDRLATGHYVRVGYSAETNRYLLYRAADRAKDQSYVLYFLSQAQLARLLFPLGDLNKHQVRALTQEAGLSCAARAESQDICFVPDGDYARFLQERAGREPEGDFVSPDGTVLGRHAGISGYTIGQRRGMGVSASQRLYVVSKDIDGNTVTLGAEDLLYTRRLTARGVSFLPFDRLDAPLRVAAKTRYSQREEAALLHPDGADGAVLEFDRPQRAVTPGQAVVFYDGDVVVGGGTIGQVVK